MHEVEEEITKTLFEAIGEEGDIMIHVDPCEPPYCPACETDDCTDRKSDFSRSPEWSVKEVISARSARK